MRKLVPMGTNNCPTNNCSCLRFPVKFLVIYANFRFDTVAAVQYITHFIFKHLYFSSVNKLEPQFDVTTFRIITRIYYMHICI